MRFTKQKLLLAGLLCSVLFSFTAAPIPAQARGLVPCGGYSDDKGTREKPCTVEDIFAMVARVTNWLIAVAGLYAVFKILQGGFWLILSMGNEEAITQKKGQITDAVVGFVLTMMAFMLINFVANFLLTRQLVTTNPACKLDLTAPLTYLNIDTSKCNGQQDSTLYAPKPTQ